MTGAGAFPFDPARLAALGRLATETRALSTPAPFPDPVVVDGLGNAFVPWPFEPGRIANVRIHVGLALGWASMPKLDAVLLSIWGGTPETGGGLHNATATLTREGLRALIADLQAIAAAAEVG